MKRFIVRKNTLPYVHQWAVLDNETDDKVGEYKTRSNAQKACNHFEEHGLSNETQSAKSDFKTIWKAANKRMKRPDGDPLPKKRYSNKRRVELDE